MAAEIELKLAFDRGFSAQDATALLRHPAVTAVRRGRPRRARVVSTYLDTPQWRLATAGIALRIRRDGTRWLQTVKGPPLAQAGGALHARGEYEWPLPGPRLDPARLASTPWRRLLGRVLASGELAPRFTTDFERRTQHLAFPDGTRATLCLDFGEIRTGRAVGRGAGRGRARSVPVAELELELEAGDAQRLFELALALTGSFPLRVSTANKAARGQALVAGDPDGWRHPVRAGSVSLDAKSPATDALRAIALECLQQIAANAAGLTHDDDPEWVHQMRVGTRRLRACLGLAARLLPPGQLAPLLEAVQSLAQVLGEARDWDVFVTETLPAVAANTAPGSPDAARLDALMAAARTRREAARAAARDVVHSPRFQQLVLAAGAICNAPGFGAGPEEPERTRADKFARAVLRRRHRRLVRRAAACATGGPQERHALRIAAKKLRYAAEFFAPLFPGRHARAYAAALAGLQDVLGRGNDAATAARLAAELRARGEPVDRALDAWLAATTAGVEPELARAWKRFARANRFWRRR